MASGGKKMNFTEKNNKGIANELEFRSLTVVFYHNMYLSLLKQGIHGVKHLAFFCCEMVV